MTVEEAGKVVAILNAGFPREALEPETFVLWASEVAILEEPELAIAAARLIVRNADHFPHLKEFRTVYRGVVERRDADERQRIRALPEGPRPEIPEFVHVWWWATNLRADRVTRRFPQTQVEIDEDDYLTPAEYEELRVEWEAAGAPRLRSVDGLTRNVARAMQS